MFIKKHKTIPAPALNVIGLDPVTDYRCEVFNHFTGKPSDEPIHNATGCALTATIALVQTRKPDPFQLAIKLGSRWFSLGAVRPDDPEIIRLLNGNQMIEYGPTADELEKRKREEEETTRQTEEEQEEKEQRTQYLQQQQEEFSRQYYEARKRHYGL